MEERELRHWIAAGEGRHGHPASVHPHDGRRRADGADGGPDAGVGRRRAGADKGGLRADEARRGGVGSRSCGGRPPPSSIRTSPTAPRTRTAPGSSTSPWRPTTRTATWCRSWRRRRRPCRTAAVAKDGTSVTWKLKRNVQWHDGKPFTADDVVFNWEYAADPATAAVTSGAVHGHQVRSTRSTATRSRSRFKNPTPFWSSAFCGPTGPDHPEAPLRGVQGRQVARGADEPQAGRHRPVPHRRLQAGRHGPRRAEPQLPHGEPALLRHDRDEGRR